MLPTPGVLVGGKYRIVRLIGEGGMGMVYEAHHEHLGSQVALKFLHPDLAQRPALVARFLQEARVSASIRSPHVTQVVDVDQTPEGEAYLVMELLEGESLERRLERGSPLPSAEAIDIGLQVLSALEAAHARGVVHRDLKPDNVWLSPAENGPLVKLLDFGIAKLKASDEFQRVTTRPGSMMGTPAYMAPEQAISADQVDHRADLYSFGVILYEMLSGARPVDADEPNEILARLMRGDVHPLGTRRTDLPPGLCALVDRLVAPDPDRRPASAVVARTELAQFARPSRRVPFEDGERPSVPATLPPDDTAPPFVTRSQAVVGGRGTTDSMAQVPALAFAPTAVATAPPAPVAPRRSRTGLWVTLFIVALLGAAGVWAYSNPSVFDTGALPPRPGPAPSAVLPPPPLDTDVAFEEPEPGPAARRRTPAVARPASPPALEPSATTMLPTLPRFPFPPFSIPSGVFPIPSVLPPYFPQVPGLTVPVAPAPSGSAAPPPK